MAVHVRLTGGSGRDQSYSNAAVEPLAGSSEELAGALRAFAAEGISHVQLVLDPITHGSIEEFAPVLELLDGS